MISLEIVIDMPRPTSHNGERETEQGKGRHHGLESDSHHGLESDSNLIFKKQCGIL